MSYLLYDLASLKVPWPLDSFIISLTERIVPRQSEDEIQAVPCCGLLYVLGVT